MNRHPRPGNYETRQRLRKRPPPAGVTVDDLDPEAVAVAPGNLRMTVVLEDGAGATLLATLGDLPKVLEAVEQSVRPLQIDLTKLADVAWARSMIATAINRRESPAAAMLALHLSWHSPGAQIPEEVDATVEEHGRACITLAIDRRLGCAATMVAAEYADPFGVLRVYATAITPAQGTA